MHQVLWFVRASLGRLSIGSWTDTPRWLQKYLEERVHALMLDRDWLRTHIELALFYGRTWAPNAITRRMLMLSSFQALQEAATLRNSHVE